MTDETEFSRAGMRIVESVSKKDYCRRKTRICVSDINSEHPKEQQRTAKSGRFVPIIVAQPLSPIESCIGSHG